MKPQGVREGQDAETCTLPRRSTADVHIVPFRHGRGMERLTGQWIPSVQRQIRSVHPPSSEPSSSLDSRAQLSLRESLNKYFVRAGLMLAAEIAGVFANVRRYRESGSDCHAGWWLSGLSGKLLPACQPPDYGGTCRRGGESLGLNASGNHQTERAGIWRQY